MSCTWNKTVSSSSQTARFYSVLYSMTQRFYVYVHNRIQRISRWTQKGQWNYVPTYLNQADHAARELPANQLALSKWLTGPTFLTDPQQHQSLPETFNLTDPKTDVQIHPQVSTNMLHDSSWAVKGLNVFQVESPSPEQLAGLHKLLVPSYKHPKAAYAMIGAIRSNPSAQSKKSNPSCSSKGSVCRGSAMHHCEGISSKEKPP